MSDVKVDAKGRHLAAPEVTMAPLLTICIPTYNRDARVRSLVARLMPFVDKYDGKIEVFVSNNCSSDGTADYLASFGSPHLRVDNRSVFLPSAEENIFSSIRNCRGTYVWFHGDDDLTDFDTLEYAMSLLSPMDESLLFFCSDYIDSNSGRTGGQFVSMNSDKLHVPVVAGALTFGLISGFAGISNMILRRSSIEKVNWREVRARAAIYAHVAVWLIAFSNYDMVVINRPLVRYRVDDAETQGAHFSRAAAKANVPNYHYWTTGFIWLLEFLEEKGILSPGDLADANDYQRDNGIFRSIDNIVHMTRNQVLASLVPIGDRNRISGSALLHISDWIVRADPAYYECMQVLSDIHSLRPNPELDPSPVDYRQSRFFPNSCSREDDTLAERLNGTFQLLLDHQVNTNREAQRRIANYYGYNIYKHISGYVAIRKGAKIAVLEELRCLDPAARAGQMLVAKTLVDLYSSIRANVESGGPAARCGADRQADIMFEEVLSIRDDVAVLKSREESRKIAQLEVVHHQTVLNLNEQVSANERLSRLVEEREAENEERSKSDQVLRAKQDETLDQLRREIRALRESTSWRITQPFRVAIMALRGR